MSNPGDIAVRGIRQTLPGGSVLGRVSLGDGPAEIIDLSRLAYHLNATGVISSFTPIAGAGISVSGATISNTGILALTQGTGITITGTNANKTITNAGVLTIVAGNGLNVGVGPGGTITSSGTLNVAFPAAGTVVAVGNTGTSFVAAASGQGINIGTGTISVASMTTGQFGGAVVGTGLAAIGAPSTLTLAPIAAGDFLANTTTASAIPTATAMATLSVGTGLNFSSGGPYTPTVAGTIALSKATSSTLGGVVVGSGITVDVNGTISVATGAGGVTSVATGTGLTGGPITGSGTISLASIAAGDLLANTGTASAAPTATPMATLTAGTGLSYSTGGPFTAVVGGTLALAAIAAGNFLANTGTVSAIPIATPLGTISTGTGLSGGPIKDGGSGTLANSGVLAIQGTTGSIIVGNGLAMSGQTLSSAATLANGGTVITLNGTTTSGVYLANAGVALVAGEHVRVAAVLNKASVTAAGVGLFDSTAQNGYILQWQTDNNLVLYRVVGGSSTSLGASGGTVPPNVNGYYSIYIDVVVDTAHGHAVWGGIQGLTSIGIKQNSSVTLDTANQFPAVLIQTSTTNCTSAIYWTGAVPN